MLSVKCRGFKLYFTFSGGEKVSQRLSITHIHSIRALLTYDYFCRDVSILTDISVTNVPTDTLKSLVIKFSIIIKLL